MAQKDFFANVANEHAHRKKESLVEHQPVLIEQNYFTYSDTHSEPYDELDFETRLAHFKEQLKDMRKKVKSYTKDRTPSPPFEHQKQFLKTFQFRYETKEDQENIQNVMEGKGSWEDVTLPHYGGPTGKWTGYYRKEFTHEKKKNKKTYLHFKGVDYIAHVYVNHRHVGTHEGFFAPFAFDVTHALKDGSNLLVVEIENDLPSIGYNNSEEDGDKIYAATGLGWDDPQEGWHHCPPGAGIYHHIYLEERSDVFIKDVFVLPDIDEKHIEIRVQVQNTSKDNVPFHLCLSLFPYNFKGKKSEDNPISDIRPAGPGSNEYIFNFPMEDFSLWTPDQPHLYQARLFLYDTNDRLKDWNSAEFGMRKFHMDEDDTEKGSLFLNNEPIVLRGANDMGHMQQCVINQDYDQLIDDILIAKMANMNFYRFTQRPVQKEIYHYCDMLGMMNQTDFPLFGYLRRNQYIEAIKQVSEMERHIKNHPSTIMISYINETFATGEKKLGHRHLYREELEGFFAAANEVVKYENPYRVIKHIEGDYDPPTHTGLSDFHCYTMWYSNHAMPIGKLHKGYLPPIKKNWKTGCGEYGTEGLDHLHVMEKYYPKEWLPENKEEEWRPDTIVRSQTNTMHGDWFEEQNQISDWIQQSQRHQALAAKLMTDSFRRRTDKVVSTAIHLLIDAWPSGWMKALVGVDRIPKPAYFAFKDSLTPTKLHFRTDRWKVYEEETTLIEAWILNDTTKAMKNCEIHATLFDDEENAHHSYQLDCDFDPVNAESKGLIKLELPKVRQRKIFHLDGTLQSKDGDILHQERISIEVFPKSKASSQSVFYLGQTALDLLKKLDIEPKPYTKEESISCPLVISDQSLYKQHQKEIEEQIKEGGCVIFLMTENWKIFDEEVSLNPILENKESGVFFIARDGSHSLTKNFEADDFAYWYNENTDHIDNTATTYIQKEDFTPLLYSYKKPGFFESTEGEKQRLPVAGYQTDDKGKYYVVSLCLEGRVGCNPILDRFLLNLLEDNNHGS